MKFPKARTVAPCPNDASILRWLKQRLGWLVPGSGWLAEDVFILSSYWIFMRSYYS